MSNHSDTQTLRWGIIGTGLIASWFVSDLLLDPSTHRQDNSIKHVVQAIGSSSSLEKVNAFWKKVGSEKTTVTSPSLYDSYSQVYNDPEVDIVYIATPHSLHVLNALDAINAGKHVLCEKPMAMNAKDAEKLISAAKVKGVFLMEAVWTRFFPLVHELKRLLHIERAIGKLTRAFIDFGLDMPLDKQTAGSRVADPALGAGALLDIGIYPLTWASLIFPTSSYGEPDVVSSLSLNGGVDETSSAILRYQGGAQAICTASYQYKTGAEFGRIEGTEGTIILHGRATSKPNAIILKRDGKSDEALEFNFQGWGFFYEADEVASDLREGRLQNSTMSLEESFRIIKLMDGIRQQSGLVYPQDSM